MATIYYLSDAESEEQFHTTSKRAAVKAAKERAARGIVCEIHAAEIARPSMALVLHLLNLGGAGWAENPRKVFTAYPPHEKLEV